MNKAIITAIQKQIEPEPITIEQIKESQKVLDNCCNCAIIVDINRKPLFIPHYING